MRGFLTSILRPGASVDRRELLRDKTGSNLSARPRVESLQPPRLWLFKQREGRRHALSQL